jgi:hypothetical protein
VHKEVRNHKVGRAGSWASIAPDIMDAKAASDELFSSSQRFDSLIFRFIRKLKFINDKRLYDHLRQYK